MKRALAALAFALAACGTGGNGEAAAGDETTTSRPATTTSVDPTEGFLVQLGLQLDGDSLEFREQAVELVTSMCDLLDNTVSGPAADDAVNDSPASDAVMSATLTEAALEMTSGTGLDPKVTATVMTLGAEAFCPQHTDVVGEYAEQLTTR